MYTLEGKNKSMAIYYGNNDNKESPQPFVDRYVKILTSIVT